jgi:hypothetical protein
LAMGEEVQAATWAVRVAMGLAGTEELALGVVELVAMVEVGMAAMAVVGMEGMEEVALEVGMTVAVGSAVGKEAAGQVDLGKAVATLAMGWEVEAARLAVATVTERGEAAAAERVEVVKMVGVIVDSVVWDLVVLEKRVLEEELVLVEMEVVDWEGAMVVPAAGFGEVMVGSAVVVVREGLEDIAMVVLWAKNSEGLGRQVKVVSYLVA